MSDTTSSDSIPATLPGLNDDVLEILVRYDSGWISAHVALLQLLAASAFEALERAFRTVAAIRTQNGHGPSNRLLEIAALFNDNRERCRQLSRDLEEQPDFEPDGTTSPERVAHYAAFFDDLVLRSPEASVAAYSLGRADVLEAATAEIAALFKTRQLLGPERTILQIGCGIGRMESALAPLVRRAVGIDISRGMIEQARVRCAALDNVSFELSGGIDLAMFNDASFDLAYAVDSFPYIVGVGMDLAGQHFAEAHRVLTARGDFVILNFSYRDDPVADQRDVARLAATSGFDLVTNGERPFQLWDGVLFQLRKR